jgi:hypothetical protein
MLPYVGYIRPEISLGAILTCSNVDLADTEEISDGRVSSNNPSLAISTPNQRSAPALEISSHGSSDELLRPARLCSMPPTNHHVV